MPPDISDDDIDPKTQFKKKLADSLMESENPKELLVDLKDKVAKC